MYAHCEAHNLNLAKLQSTSVAQKWGTDVKFQDKRVKKTKGHLDELAGDHRLNIPEERF